MRDFGSLKYLFKHYELQHAACRGEPSNETSSCDDFSPVNDCIIHENSLEIDSNEGSPETVAEHDFDELLHILKLYQINNINRSNVTDIIAANIELAEAKGLKAPFVNLTTEYLIQKALKSLDLWNEPKDIDVIHHETYKKINNSQVIESVPLRIPILGLEKSFQNYFNAQSRLQYALEYMSSTSEIMADVKDTQSLPPNTFPFVLFYDEMETGNPLGSHKGLHKIGMFYVGL